MQNGGARAWIAFEPVQDLAARAATMDRQDPAAGRAATYPIRSEPDGLGKIRLLSSKREKRLLEELIPITQYIQTRYHVGNRMKVRWLSGSQPYDAIIWTPLPMVDKGGMPRKITIEVTTIVRVIEKSRHPAFDDAR